MTLSAPQLGKTVAVACWMLATAWQQPGRLFWWGAPTYQQNLSGYEALREMAFSAGVLASAGTSPGSATITLIQGSKVQFKSWERPENLSGPTVYGLVLDEAHLLTLDAWKIFRARLTATGGPMRIIGNAGDPEEVFKGVCDEAADPANAAEQGFHRWTYEEMLAALSDSTRPTRAQYAATIEAERRAFAGAPYIFRAMYLAEWVASVNAAFDPDAIDRATVLEPQGPAPGGRYAIWWDIAQAVDFTVGVAVRCDVRPRCAVAMRRMARMNYPEVADEIERYALAFGTPDRVLSVVEVNGPGKPVYDELVRRGRIRVAAWTTDNENKRRAFIDLGADVENGDLLLAHLPPLQQELKSVRSTRNRTGTYSFEAPGGRHDDCAMSLACGNFVARWADPASQEVRLVRVA